MSIFSSILDRIRGHRGADATRADAQAEMPAATAARQTATPASAPGPAGAAPASQPRPTAAPGAPQQEVDVVAVLTDMASKNPQKLDWRHSIVDLMKLLGLDSSLEARKQLAQELHYGGDPNDSAAMNIWLHRQVMQKLAENGGRVPDELRR